MSQQELGAACGISQSGVSRLETNRASSYDMTLLGRAAAHLQIPPRLVGLADDAVAHAQSDGANVERRSFLTAGVATLATPTLSTMALDPRSEDTGQVAPLRLATTAFRRMDGSTPSRHLVEPVLAHLRLTQLLASEAEHDDRRARIAAAGSEAASLAGWLSWDMGDHGSTRTWYGAAVKAARRAGDPLLIAYQLGSLAQFESHAGNSAQALRLIKSARRQLGDSTPAIADAWLATVEALAHATGGNRDAADSALSNALHASRRIPGEAPPWPWVFSFTESKVAACRLTCGARLGQPGWIAEAQKAAGSALSSGHVKQRALLSLDIAAGHLAAGRLDAAFILGMGALEAGLRYRSGRIVERSRALRQAYTSSTPAKVVRDFDERLHSAYL
jgi:transcriptional regulator with XRE-family HTH domain